MILPNTYTAALLLTILTMICWGSWANTQKLTGKWRFELFYYDFAFGLLLCAILGAVTFGSMNTSELSVLDNFSIAGYRKMAYGLAAGVVFNLANMLLVAAISVAGMSVAFPISIGLALVIGVCWNYLLNQQGNPLFLFAGVGIILVAIVVNALAYQLFSKERGKVVEPAPVLKAGRSRPKEARKPAGFTTGLVVSLISGVLMGSFYPLVEISKDSEIGLAPYTAILLFGIGVFLSTLFFGLFFLNFPISGEPVDIIGYFKGTRRQHLLGMAGGAIWCIGATANFAAASAPPQVHVGPAVSYAMGQGATLISALWGIFVWKEFDGASPRVRTMLGAMLALFVVGLVLVSIAPLR